MTIKTFFSYLFRIKREFDDYPKIESLPEFFPDFCEVEECMAKLNELNKFKCIYCKHYFCDTHRLPESHNCVGNPTIPLTMKIGATKSKLFK